MTCRLFSTYFVDPHPERKQEMDRCLVSNMTVFDRLSYLCDLDFDPDDFPPIKLPNVIIVTGAFRPTFADALVEATRDAEPDDLCVIANGDIEIPRDAIYYMNEVLGPDDALALSRWEGEMLCDLEYSQDCWAFRGNPKPKIGGEYFFGTPGCDNRFAYELQQAGYRVTNPSRTIRTYHHHQSGIRTATNHRKNRVPKPYLFIAPTALEAVNA